MKAVMERNRPPVVLVNEIGSVALQNDRRVAISK